MGSIGVLFIYIIALVIAIVIDYIVAKQFSYIAEMKGHRGSTYFWFTFILGVVGMLMVVALPDVSRKESYQPSMCNTTDKDAYNESRPIGADEWKCTCGKIHKNYESSCVCGVKKFEAKALQND